jgi:hypothetical protein
MVTEEGSLPSWLTGVNWHLHPMPNGTWRLVNQNEIEYCLTDMSGRPGLGPTIAGPAGSSSNWLIYQKSGQNAFCLRPQNGHWLCWRDGEIVLGARNGVDDDSAVWRFRVTVEPIASEPTEAPKNILNRTLRAWVAQRMTFRGDRK